MSHPEFGTQIEEVILIGQKFAPFCELNIEELIDTHPAKKNTKGYSSSLLLRLGMSVDIPFSVSATPDIRTFSPAITPFNSGGYQIDDYDMNLESRIEKLSKIDAARKNIYPEIDMANPLHLGVEIYNYRLKELNLADWNRERMTYEYDQILPDLLKRLHIAVAFPNVFYITKVDETGLELGSHITFDSFYDPARGPLPNMRTSFQILHNLSLRKDGIGIAVPSDIEKLKKIEMQFLLPADLKIKALQ